MFETKKDKFKGYKLKNKIFFVLDDSVGPPVKASFNDANFHLECFSSMNNETKSGKKSNKNYSRMPVIGELAEVEEFPKYTCTKTLQGHSEKIVSLIQLESGLIVTGDQGNNIYFWDLEQQKYIKKIKVDGNALSLLEFSPNYLLVGLGEKDQDNNNNNNNYIELINLSSEDKEILFKFPGHELWVNCLEKCNDKIFASASNDYTIKIWDYYERKEIRKIDAHEDCIMSLIKLENGNLCSGGADLLIKIWDWKIGTCIYQMVGHTNWIKCLCQIDNDTILSGSDDKTIKIWKKYEESGTLEGHQKPIRSICKINNNFFSSASFDNTIKIWDLQNLKCVQTLTGHESNVIKIIKLKDSSTLVSCSFDKTIKIWDQI